MNAKNCIENSTGADAVLPITLHCNPISIRDKDTKNLICELDLKLPAYGRSLEQPLCPELGNSLKDKIL